jgi:hypothetical protein
VRLQESSDLRGPLLPCLGRELAEVGDQFVDVEVGQRVAIVPGVDPRLFRDLVDLWPQIQFAFESHDVVPGIGATVAG